MELVKPDIGLIFWMTLSFLVLLFVLGRFAWKPVLKMLNEREQSIDEALHAADIARAEMEKLKFSNEQLLREAKEQRDVILKDARSIRDNIIDEARVKADEEAERIIQSAKDSIHFEKMAAITGLKNQVATLSVQIAERIIKEEMAESGKHDVLVKQLLDEVRFN